MTEKPSAAVGTVIRAPKVKAFAEEARFRGFDVVDVDAGFFRLYRLSRDAPGPNHDTVPRWLDKVLAERR